jgi:hypothetical protein
MLPECLRCLRILTLSTYFLVFSSNLVSANENSSIGVDDPEKVSPEKVSPEKASNEQKYQYDLAERLGWKLHIRRELKDSDPEKLKVALDILEKQLDEVVRVVPPGAVEKLRTVPLWFSPVYPNEQPRAEYHPGAGWLKEHSRDEAMVKGVEFSNIGIFEAEFRRMPNFALHELAHAYHDQFLDQGFSNRLIQQSYDQAKGSGNYQSVEQRFGDGTSKQSRAYAMSNPAEYFAESTEAFFSTNDFYPFTREQLTKHDPTIADLISKLWK